MTPQEFLEYITGETTLEPTTDARSVDDNTCMMVVENTEGERFLLQVRRLLP